MEFPDVIHVSFEKDGDSGYFAAERDPEQLLDASGKTKTIARYVLKEVREGRLVASFNEPDGPPAPA